MKLTYFLISILFSLTSFAQEVAIDSIVIDRQLPKAHYFSKIQTLKSDEILNNATSLSDLLRFQTPIYIKENGRGMTSSPSFRGTTAQQTNVVWNGIGINSHFLGQADLNNISLAGYDKISIKYGGGSLLYGSGAIGGSIHLNNSFNYNQGLNHLLFLEYASFGTFNTSLKTSYSTDNLSVQFSAGHNQSDNNYVVKEKYYVNQNAHYNNTSINIGLAYRLSTHHELYSQTQHYDAVQHYPLLSEFATPTHYNSQTFRSLVGWKTKSSTIKNDLKIAYLTDGYQYYMNSDVANSKTGGETKQYIIKNDFTYQLTSTSELNALVDFGKIEAQGFKTGIPSIFRHQGSAALLYRNTDIKNFEWEAGLKKEYIEAINSPFLFSAAGHYRLNPYYTIKGSLSKNFRAPSFNDLYWQPGGNKALKPESSYQFEFSQNLNWKNIHASLTPYYININDMIRWIPGPNGIWHAVNTAKVKSLGIEALVGYDNNIGPIHYHSQLSYAYTKSEDQDLKKQLAYVPFHKVNFNAKASYKKIDIHAQALWNSTTFSDAEETKQYQLDGFYVINLGTDINILNHLKIGFKVNNLTSEIYRTVLGYYMPKRHYSINMNFKF